MRFSSRWLSAVILAASLCAPQARAGTCVRDLPRYSPAPPPERIVPDTFELPHLHVSARWRGNSLMFTDASGTSYAAGDFVPGYDDRSWRGIDELDGAWLWLAGGDFSYAVKFAQGGDGHWRAVRRVLIAPKEAAGDDLIGRLFGFDRDVRKKTGVDAEIIVSHPYEMRYSPAIRRLMFFKSGQELVDGHVRALAGGGSYGLKYIGDVPRSAIALMRAPNGQLYGYDGATLRPVTGGNVASDLRALPPRTTPGPYWGRIVDVPDAGKSFYMLDNAVFEIQSAQGQLALRRVTLPAEPDLFFTRIVAMDGRLAVLTRQHIYWLDDPTPLYSTAPGYETQINTTGSDIYPRFEARQKGIVFSTGGDDPAHGLLPLYHVFGTCGVRR